MSAFAARVVAIDSVEAHPDADAIEIAMIGRYRSIVRKAEAFQAGDRVLYIPQASLLPEYLLRRLGLWDDELSRGRLGGPEFNRVSPRRLRGVFSQGLCMKVLPAAEAGRYLVEGDGIVVEAAEDEDVSEALGIAKWVPVIPAELLGDVFAPGQQLTVDFDVEDIKAYPHVIRVGEEVEFREKLHGVFTGVTVLPKSDAVAEAFGADRNVLVYSKGLGAQGMAFADTADNASLPYVKATASLREKLAAYAADPAEPLSILGETFGPGVQDLHYGDRIQFRVFAACRGYRGDHRFLDADDLRRLAEDLGAEMVPVLYRGPFSWEALEEHTSGKTAMDAKNIREGVVVTPVKEREDMRLGRVALKSVSEAYLLRKGGTEFS